MPGPAAANGPPPGTPPRRLGLGITGKLLLVNLLVFAAFGTVVAIVSLSFQSIEGLLTTAIVSDVNENIESTALLKELSAVFADANLLAMTFFGDENLKPKADLLVEATQDLERKRMHAPLRDSLAAFSRELRLLFDHCAEINRILANARGYEQELHSDLNALERAVADRKLQQVLAGEDPTLMEQLSVLVSSYREAFLQINVSFVRSTFAHDTDATQRPGASLVSLIDELSLRFRAITASEARIAAHGPRLLGILGRYRRTVVELARAIDELDRRRAAVERSKSGVIGVMAQIDRDIAASTRTMGQKISAVMDDAARYVVLASVALLALMAGLSIRFIISNVRRPIAAIHAGIDAIRAGRLDARIAVDRRDEWGVIGEAVNRMAADLAAQEAAQKKLEEQLRQSQKMEAIGTLAGGIAHDFNNILTAILGYASLLQFAMPENDPLKEHVDGILSSSDRAATLTRSLLAFSRKQVLSPRPVHLNDLVKNVEALLPRIIGEEIEFRTTLPDEDLTIMADGGQIEQVLVNLATNARDAMPAGGTVSIATQRVDVGADSTFLDIEPGAYAVLSLSDTGKGMDEATRVRIFEPFFTTKEVGKGTGLGLSMVYGIVKQHRGEIRVYSEPGHGTTFKIYLRLTATRAERTATRSPARAVLPARGTGTILVAEDDPEVRKLVRRVLTEFGYKVIEAVDGEDAVQKFTANKDEVQLLILDVVMPKMNGKEASEEIRRVKAGVAVLFSSGYTAEIVTKKGILEEGIHFVSKPVVPEMLLAKVREMLGG